MTKKRKVPEKPITFTVPLEIIAEVERVAEKRRIPKAQVYKMMIELGLDLHRDLEKVGVIPLMDFALSVKLAITEKYNAPPQPRPY